MKTEAKYNIGDRLWTYPNSITIMGSDICIIQITVVKINISLDDIGNVSIFYSDHYDNEYDEVDLYLTAQDAIENYEN